MYICVYVRVIGPQTKRFEFDESDVCVAVIGACAVLPERFLEHKVMVTGWLLNKLQRILPRPLPFSHASHAEVVVCVCESV